MASEDKTSNKAAAKNKRRRHKEGLHKFETHANRIETALKMNEKFLEFADLGVSKNDSILLTVFNLLSLI